MHKIRRLSTFIGQTFALWAIVFAIIGYSLPQPFVPLKGSIPYALGVIMFGMGLTLRARDFEEIVRRPAQVLLGIVAQFLIMPLWPWRWYTFLRWIRWLRSASSSSAAARAARPATS